MNKLTNSKVIQAFLNLIVFYFLQRERELVFLLATMRWRHFRNIFPILAFIIFRLSLQTK